MFDTIEIKDVKSEIRSLVRALRKQRGISQIQLAETIDVSRTTIQNLELGRNFTIDTVLKVIKEMDLLEPLQSEISQAQNHITHSKSMY